MARLPQPLSRSRNFIVAAMIQGKEAGLALANGVLISSATKLQSISLGDTGIEA